MQWNPDPFLISLFSKLRRKGKGDAASILPKAVYINGSYDSYLLSENITSENFSFGFGGIVEIIRGQGLGLIVNETGPWRLSVGEIGCLPEMGNS